MMHRVPSLAERLPFDHRLLLHWYHIPDRCRLVAEAAVHYLPVGYLVGGEVVLYDVILNVLGLEFPDDGSPLYLVEPLEDWGTLVLRLDDKMVYWGCLVGRYALSLRFWVDDFLELLFDRIFFAGRLIGLVGSLRPVNTLEAVQVLLRVALQSQIQLLLRLETLVGLGL